MKEIILCFALLSGPAFAQQQPPEPAKLAPLYQQQRNSALDGLAACVAASSDLQAKISDLEKKLAQKEGH
jgi:hypothetical protein